MQITTDVDLQSFNTLAVPSTAEHFVQVRSSADLDDALKWARESRCAVHVIGGGSNVVLREHLKGLTLLIHLQGRDVLTQSDRDVCIRVGAGENWHDFVVWCLAHEFYGLENLALIPGTVGAAPVQNIGAYGVEVAQFIEQVEGVVQTTGEFFRLSGQECDFAYRDSCFKRSDASPRVITHVVFRLPRLFQPNLQYPALADELEGQQVTAANIFASVCRIRSAKLPDPARLPNCGSFFKNPVIAQAQFEKLHTLYPLMPSFAPGTVGVSPTAERYRKIAAGWLIDQLGWRGQTRLGVSVHHAQALVLTNAGRRPADAVLGLARDIQCSVKERFDVALELEPQVMGN